MARHRRRLKVKQLIQLKQNLKDLIDGLSEDISALNDQIIELEDAKTQMEDIVYQLNVEEAETQHELVKAKKSKKRDGSVFEFLLSIMGDKVWTMKELSKATLMKPGTLGFHLRAHKRALIRKQKGTKVTWQFK
jgi:hypothetical protein